MAKLDDREFKQRKETFARRIWARDPGLFTSGEEDYPAVLNRLGWLQAPEEGLARVDEVEGFVNSLIKEGYRTAVVLGMGGSSLCPLVLSRVFSAGPPYLDLDVIDTTSPGVVGDHLDKLDPSTTVFILSSKSGTTVEALSLYEIFRQRLAGEVERPQDHFAAVTDSGSPLDLMARREGFRKVFLAPADVGGRYSALTFFGMVPAGLMGLDVRRILQKAQDMVERCGMDKTLPRNPGVSLGAWMAEQAGVGRDKLTILTSPSLAPFALWLEQLLAESTGKEGLGVVPVHGEPPADPEGYGDDRCFVYMELAGDEKTVPDPTRLKTAGFPVQSFVVGSPDELGAEFFRWEMAVAALGSLLGINPFDEPNVAESKKNTSALLDAHEGGKAFEPVSHELERGPFIISLPDEDLGSAEEHVTGISELFDLFLAPVRPGDYLVIAAYLPYGPSVEGPIEELRAHVLSRKKAATTFGYGPRYLHSTGQLHKGGPENGHFLFLTEPDSRRIIIPGRPYTLWELQAAQALGDEKALRGRGRRVLRIHLKNGVTDLAELVRTISG